MEKPLTIKQVLELLPFGEETVYRLCRKKLMPHYKIGRNVYFDKTKVLFWLESKAQKVRKPAGRRAAFNPEEYEEVVR